MARTYVHDHARGVGEVDPVHQRLANRAVRILNVLELHARRRRSGDAGADERRRLEAILYEMLQRLRIHPQPVTGVAEIHVGAAKSHGPHGAAVSGAGKRRGVATRRQADVCSTVLTMLAPDKYEAEALGAANGCQA